MWYPVSLKIVDLFSYRESVIDFSLKKGRLTCIYGSNQTDPKTLSNGSGKTSLLDCVSIALIGSPLRDISKKEIVRNGCTSGTLALYLKNNVTNQELLIKELVEKTKSNKVEVWENGKLNDQLKDLAPKEAHKYILSLIDISEDDLLNYYLLSRKTYTSFFTTKDSEKKEVINRFSKADVVDPIDGFIKDDISKVENEIIKINQIIVGKNAKIEVLTEQINELKLVDQNQAKKEIIKGVEKQIIEISDQIEEAQKEIERLDQSKLPLSNELSKLEKDKSIDEKLKSVTSEIEIFNTSIQKERTNYLSIDKKYEKDIRSIDNEIKLFEIGIDDHKTNKGLVNDLISEIERNIADEIECPSCHHKFCFKDKEYNLEEAKKQLPTLREEVETYNKEIKRCTEEKDVLKKKKDNILHDKEKDQKSSIEKGKDFTTKLTKLNTEETTLKAQNKSYQDKINDLKLEIPKIDTDTKIKKNNIKAFEEQLEVLVKQLEVEEKKEVEDKTISLQAQIDNIGLEILNTDNDLREEENKKELLNTWRVRFKKFKSYLANNSIGMIESLSNHYLQGMQTHLSVAIDGFREKADGTLKEEILIEVSRDGGITRENFNKFSAGEQAKVDVAGILAMQKLINLNSKSGGFDLLWIDEIIDAIDRVALGELVQSLDKVGQTIMLISHIDLPDMESAIKVEKKFGISQIIV